MKNKNIIRSKFTWSFAALCLVSLVYYGCEVTNPGPVQDEFLNDPGAHDAVVEGANYSLSVALWMTSYFGEEAIGNVTRSGRNFCCPKVPPRVGDFRREIGGDMSTVWNNTHRARWVAEDAFRRFGETVDNISSYENAAWAKLYAGYANRLLGENMCQAVIDGGEVQPGEVYFQRAEAAFSDAIDIGQSAGVTEIVNAAYAGRAAARGAGLGDWTGAVSDADQVPDGFVFQAQYSSLESSQYNHMYELGSGDPWVDWTLHGSFFEDYYQQTGDPRARWEDTGRDDTPLDLPLFRQLKYTSRSDNVNLSSSNEMELIRAEAELRNGQWEDAMDRINDLRATYTSDLTDQPLQERVAANEEEAWTHFKEERRIELWLEGRHMYDLRRWIDDGTPGDMEDTSDLIRLCFPIPNSEADTNPNVGRDHNDPVNPNYTG